MSFLSRRKKVVRYERVPDKIVDVRPKQSPPTVLPPTQPEEKTQQQKHPTTISDVTAIIVNFKTLWLAQQAYRSLTALYDIPVILVDNGSNDVETTNWINSMGGICNADNIGHGPAMHAAIQRIETPYVLTFDSDCIAEKSGWLEEMLAMQVYAVGWLRYVDRFTGVPLEWHLNHPPASQFVPYVHPAVGLYEIERYKTLRPFFNHGAPALWNMIDAEKQGYVVKDYPVFKYVKHLVAGTRRMYGGRWNPSSKEKSDVWNKSQNFPI